MDELTNFRRTLVQLKAFAAIPIINDRDRAGVIHAFEYTFEQCWESIQKVAATSGLRTPSPKSSFMFAFRNSWIAKDQELIWLKMIEDRNMTSHAYKEDVAKEVLERILKNYIPCFSELLKELEKSG